MKNSQIAVRFDEETMKWIRERAEAEGLEPSTFIRSTFVKMSKGISIPPVIKMASVEKPEPSSEPRDKIKMVMEEAEKDSGITDGFSPMTAYACYYAPVFVEKAINSLIKKNPELKFSSDEKYKIMEYWRKKITENFDPDDLSRQMREIKENASYEKSMEKYGVEKAWGLEPDLPKRKKQFERPDWLDKTDPAKETFLLSMYYQGKIGKEVRWEDYLKK